YAKFNFDGKEFSYFSVYEFNVSEGPKGEGIASASLAGNQLMIGLGKGDKAAPALDHGFGIFSDNPVQGKNNISCEKKGGGSSVTFTWMSEFVDKYKGYENINLNLYKVEFGGCQQRRTCTTVTVTLNEFKPGPPGT